MENSSKLNFNSVLKIILIIYLGYFLFLLTIIVYTHKNGSEIGRYQIVENTNYMFDSKTGMHQVSELKSK